jgi:hypothetical protein
VPDDDYGLRPRRRPGLGARVDRLYCPRAPREPGREPGLGRRDPSRQAAPAKHPTARPAPPEDPRDFLHLCAIEAWRALASGQPGPALDPEALEQEISDAFGGSSPLDELYDDWLKAARERGITVNDEHGDILPAIAETIIPALTAAFWSGLTTGHFTITRRRYFIPRKLMPYFEGTTTGSRGR